MPTAKKDSEVHIRFFCVAPGVYQSAHGVTIRDCYDPSGRIARSPTGRVGRMRWQSFGPDEKPLYAKGPTLRIVVRTIEEREARDH